VGLALLLASCREHVTPAPADAGALAARDAGVAVAAPPFREGRQSAGLLLELSDAGLGLVFASERSGAPQLHRWDGAEERALTMGAAGVHLQAVASRTREALVTLVEGPAEQLLAVQLDDGGVRALAPPMEKAHAAALSFDETEVVFEASLTHAAGLAIVPFDGQSLPRPIGELGQTGSFQPAFTLDRRVIFTNSSTGDPEVYLQALDGGPATQLTAFHLEDFGAVPAPDGQRFAFVSNREGSDRVFVQRLDGRGVARLMTEKRSTEDTERDPVWMPDGKSVLVTVKVGPASRIARVDMATHKTVWTSAGPGNEQLPRPSRDGRFIAFVSDREGNADVFVMRANGSDATAVTKHASAEYEPRWFDSARGR